jgi:hypothetical protein
MNKMPCHITDEHVYNPWEEDGDEDYEEPIEDEEE